MKKGLIALSILLIVLVYLFYPEKVIIYPAGITASEKDLLSNPYLISENDNGTMDKNGEIISPRIGLETKAAVW